MYSPVTSNGRLFLWLDMKVLDLITDTGNTKLIHLFDFLGMALAPFNVLAGGKLRTDEEEARREESGEKGRALFNDWKRNAQEREMSLALEKVAKDVGAKSITSGKFRVPTFLSLAYVSQVAIAYLMQKVPFVFPIVGGRKVEHLLQNIEALDIVLSVEQMQYIESIIPFDLGFPSNLIVSRSRYFWTNLSHKKPVHQGTGTTHVRGLTSSGNLVKQPPLQAIRPTANAKSSDTF